MDRHPRHGNAPRHRHHLTTRKFRNQKQPSGNRRLFLCEESCEVAAGASPHPTVCIILHSYFSHRSRQTCRFGCRIRAPPLFAPQLPDSRRRMQKPRKFASSCIGIQRCGFSWIDRRKTDVYEENHPEGWFSTLAVRGTLYHENIRFSPVGLRRIRLSLTSRWCST